MTLKEPKMQQYFTSVVMLALAGCSTLKTEKVKTERNGATHAAASATLARTDGAVAGTATLLQRGDGLMLNVTMKNMVSGTYGIHLHAIGKCEGPDFASAGGHWNPQAKQHGFNNPMGAHHGDLPNLVANARGAATLAVKLEAVPLSGEGGALDVDGLAIVIHEKPDDYKSDPSGNSGKRIICGVFIKQEAG
jgi:superoxide dismutase, Cu-Zn family